MPDLLYEKYPDKHYAVFTMTVHPDVSGHPQVLMMLERMHAYITSHEGASFHTFDEIADDFARRSPRRSAG